MPFKSKKQRSYLYAKHPKLAKEWALKYGNEVEGEKKKSPWLKMKTKKEENK